MQAEQKGFGTSATDSKIWISIFKRPAALLTVIFLLTRLAYWTVGEVRFNAKSVDYYFQFLDPLLLRTALLQSIWYLNFQMPGLNFLTGIALKLFPQHFQIVLGLMFTVLSLASCLLLLSLMLRMRVKLSVALLIAGFYTVSPATILYENWLFYNQIIVFCFTLGAWALHRYISERHAVDGVLFFLALFGLALMRVVYHLFWYFGFAAALFFILPVVQRRTAYAAALPGLVLTAIYLKSVILFGTLVPGGAVQSSNNLWLMHMQLASPEKLKSAVRAGRIADVVLTSNYEIHQKDFTSLIPLPKPTGIPARDEPTKSTGAPNWNSVWFEDYFKRLDTFRPNLEREFPGMYWMSVAKNVMHYFRPEISVFPFTYEEHFPLTHRMLRVVSFFTSITYNLPKTQRPYAGVLTILALLAAGLLRIWSYLVTCIHQRRVLPDADGLTVLFCVFNILFLAIATIFGSYGETERYRNEVSTLYVVLCGVFAMDAGVWFRRRLAALRTGRQSRRVTNSARIM